MGPNGDDGADGDDGFPPPAAAKGAVPARDPADDADRTVCWVAFDDTDSRQGGCTTWLATEVVRALAKDGVALAGPPRLVRLNPMAPDKTRGNGAVALPLAVDGAEPRGRGDGSQDAAVGRTIDRVWDVVLAHARAREGADPGLVACPPGVARPGPALYRAAVSRMVARAEALAHLPDGATVLGGRGAIGAAAALAWRPGDRTWEVLAYREADRWGTPRDVDPASVRAAEAAVEGAFDCYDRVHGEATMVPNGPDPVLWGLRGDDPKALVEGRHVLTGEPVDRWLLWETNQGTDDHLTRQGCGRLAPDTCPVVTGEVASEPRTREGGHVFVEVADGTGSCTLAAFEPTKGFRDVVRRLVPGDAVTAAGGTRDGRTVHLEKLEVRGLAEVVEKVANPRCAPCGKQMKSRGAGAGYRCARCGADAGEDRATWRRVDRAVGEGWHEVPTRARRHLAKPLERLKRLNNGAPMAGRARVAKPGQRR